jgi:hypothetical protein
MLSYLVRLVGAPRVRLRRAAQTTIARMPAAHSACRPSCERNGDLGVLSAPISELSRLLLAWWQEHGRHTIPWKVGADGRPAADGKPLNPFPIWCAEVMRAASQHSSCVSPASP